MIVTVKSETLTEIADAIRNKNGSQTQYTPSDMADAISAISGSGEGPMLNKITEAEGQAWINTGINVSNYEYFIFKQYINETLSHVYTKIIADIVVYTGMGDPYTTVCSIHNVQYNIRIYNNELWVSYNIARSTTNYMEVYGMEVS